MNSADGRLRQIRVIAQCVTGLTLMVVLVSACMRLEGAGLGCADWPECYAQALSSEPQALHFGIVRILHRIGASSSLLLACFLVWRCLRPYPIQPAALQALLLLMLMLLLAILGPWSSDPRLPLVGFLNIMGGLLLVNLSWRVVLSTDTTPESENAGRAGILLRLGVASLSLTVMLGAWMGASYAALACSTLPDCNGVWWPSAKGWAALNPWIRLTAAPLPGDAGGVALHLLHRYLALAAVLLLGMTCLRSLRNAATRVSALAVLALLFFEFGLGGASVSSGLNLWLVVSHGVCTAVLLAAVITLQRRQRSVATMQ
ncbi:Cytochrome oxidase assembly [Candidatus Propionivibrio aalborgensis]|uniref:Cytochrome oxidase assembly n=1 Tax=Candidatus Propionivibrio aalborgensis TaxID=1860101 RepID=A0A1A8Y1N8_9RHOO|nr:COX15/CtaA family protein [Candidatus Propionivibrio aalborgensis]SBT10917.1 Cytochrome oxidase assembly [Candidatus Propionivibrio aalborgensis]